MFGEICAVLGQEDRSSDIAIINTLYFALPQLVIRKILEKYLVNNFDKIS